MGIDNVAIKTFNSSGAQSVCRANEADETKLIESQFLTKCTTEYINGSGMTYIQGTSGLDLSGSTVQPETFYLPSDCDAISDIVYSAIAVTGTDLTVTNINKIEVKVGNLVVQTIKPDDIKNRNVTELGYTSTTGPVFSIPFIGRSKNVRNSFLQAGAVTNAMSLKITYNTGVTGVSNLTTSLCVTTHQITKTEKDFLAKNIINRVVNVSQNKSQDLSTSNVVDLSSIHINVSHILISSTTSGFSSVELVLGNDRTGNIPIVLLQSALNAELFSLAAGTTDVYIIKTADSAFSTAGIPFSRLNNKKLIFNNGSTGSTGTVNVTVCGTQIQTTVGGSISFSS